MVYQYTAFEWALIFFVYCFLGWCMESAFVSLKQHQFVNRGFLRGPVLPIYGFGAIIILHVALFVDGQPVALFCVGMIAATVFEYVVGTLMESLFKVKYWDYSDHKIQFQGKICMSSTVSWGFLSLFVTYVIEPPITDVILAIPKTIAIVLVCVIGAGILMDTFISARAAFRLANMLEELTKLQEEAERLRKQMSEMAAETREKLEEAAQETREKLEDSAIAARERLEDAAQEAREKLEKSTVERKVQEAENALRRRKLQDSLDAVVAKYNARAGSMRPASKSLVRGNPTAVSSRCNEALQEVRDRLDKRKSRS